MERKTPSAPVHSPRPPTRVAVRNHLIAGQVSLIVFGFQVFPFFSVSPVRQSKFECFELGSIAVNSKALIFRKEREARRCM